MIGRLAGDDAACAAASDAIARILAGSFEAPEQRWSAASVAETLSLPGTVAFLARDDAEARACALLRIIADEAEILTVAVLPAARRQGLGSRLIAACIGAATARGASRLHLEVGASNGAARALYRLAGFAEAGRRVGYYRSAHGREDALLMALELARS